MWIAADNTIRRSAETFEVKSGRRILSDDDFLLKIIVVNSAL
jgi:hypothetical protein